MQQHATIWNHTANMQPYTSIYSHIQLHSIILNLIQQHTTIYANINNPIQQYEALYYPIEYEFIVSHILSYGGVCFHKKLH